MRSPMPRRPRGFTLIELLLVAGLILAAAAMIVPSVLSMQESNRLARTADDLRGLLVGLRVRAMEEGVPYEWGIGADGQSHFVRKADDLASAAASETAPAADANGQRVEFDGPNANGAVPLPKGVKLELLGSGLQNPQNASTAAAVRFEPDGTASGSSFRIVDESQGQVLGRVRSLTGAVIFERQALAAGGGS